MTIDGETILLILESLVIVGAAGYILCLRKSPNALRYLGYCLLARAQAEEEKTAALLGIEHERAQAVRRMEQNRAARVALRVDVEMGVDEIEESRGGRER